MVVVIMTPSQVNTWKSNLFMNFRFSHCPWTQHRLPLTFPLPSKSKVNLFTCRKRTIDGRTWALKLISERCMSECVSAELTGEPSEVCTPVRERSNLKPLHILTELGYLHVHISHALTWRWSVDAAEKLDGPGAEEGESHEPHLQSHRTADPEEICLLYGSRGARICYLYVSIFGQFSESHPSPTRNSRVVERSFGACAVRLTVIWPMTFVWNFFFFW